MKKNLNRHISHIKQFGKSPEVTVVVRDKRDYLNTENEVLINWSCVGLVSLIEAGEFHQNLATALQYASKQRKRLFPNK